MTDLEKFHEALPITIKLKTMMKYKSYWLYLKQPNIWDILQSLIWLVEFFFKE